MSFLDKVLGRKRDAAQPPALKPPPASPPPPGAPAMMKVWDAYGRIGEIPREAWRTEVLPLNFRKAWNQPEELANLIHVTLNDGFIADCLEPARQLHRIDPVPKRGATYLAVILLQLKKFDEAEGVIAETLRKHGDDGALLTNLAKAQSGKGEQALAERTLWHAIEVDPNLDNGLLWYEAIQRERGGEDAGLDAMRRAAALPGSWRAQLWLARAALKSRQLDQALALYRESLSRAGKPVPAALLQQVSGDLGNAGHLPEILQLVEPHFDAAIHGIEAGNNLIKAHLDLGQIDAARGMVDRLYALKRTDWKELLAFWDTELAKARVATASEREEPMQVAMLTIEGPVWLKPDSPAADLFPAKPKDATVVAFLGCAAEIATNSQRVQQQMADPPGRSSRALPLFLAEQVEFVSRARVLTLVPWMMGETPGFVVCGGAWEDDAAANYARQGNIKSDYVVTTLIKTASDPWTAELRLVRTIDGKCLGTLDGTFPSGRPEEGIPALARRLLGLLREQAEVEPAPVSPVYQVPAAPHFANYLLRLEQLLAVRCSGMDGVPPGFLNCEREILDGNLQLCLDFPANVGTRILLAQTLLAMKLPRPTIVPEYKEKIALLQKEKPLPEPAHGVVQRILNEALTA